MEMPLFFELTVVDPYHLYDLNDKFQLCNAALAVA